MTQERVRFPGYVLVSEIMRIEFDDSTKSPLQLKPEFQLVVTRPDDQVTPVQISYVDHGMFWRPTYRLNIGADETLTVEQQATVRNNLDDLKDAELQLITGAPNVMFEDKVEELFRVTPLTVGQSNLAPIGGGNMGQGGLGGGAGFGGFGGGAAEMERDLSEPEPVVMQEGVDLHYQSIGKHTLNRGEVLSLRTESKQTPFERLVEWTPTGTDVQDQPVADPNAPWDAVRFKNPFDFPLTTGPVTFTYENRFQGQAQLYFASPGEPITLRVTKALSILTEVTEAIDKTEPIKLTLFGNEHWKRTHSTRLWIHNLRSKSVPVVVRRSFSGELVQAEGDPERKGQAAQNQASNPHTQLTWRFDLDAGQERTLHFTYTTISDRRPQQ